MYVPASCIPDVGAVGKGIAGVAGVAGIGRLRHGDLLRFGYAKEATQRQRHQALARAVRAYGTLSVFRKLNAIYIYTRRTSPPSSAIFKADRDWIKTHYGFSS